MVVIKFSEGKVFVIVFYIKCLWAKDIGEINYNFKRGEGGQRKHKITCLQVKNKLKGLVRKVW
jgi:hypothetical protein